MPVKMNTASSGSVTLTPADTASNVTLTVPAQDGTVIAANSSGNVGIGTSSPARKLQVHESAAGTNGYIQLTNAATGSSSTDGFQIIVGTGGESILVQRENAEMQFWTNNTEQARISSGGLLQFNSGYGSVATAYGCRAWVNFNGTGTVAIRGSGNVSSITDGGVGNYRVNFTNAMPDVNYSVSTTGRHITEGSTNGRYFLGNSGTGMSTTNVQVFMVNAADNAFLDPEIYCVAVFR